MSQFPHLPLFTDAFLADTGHLSAQETGAYLLLLMVAWRSPECRLPDDDAKLARWARLDARTWRRIKPTVMEFWSLQSGFWMQKRLSREREFVSKRAEVARQNGLQGGRPKSLENKETANPAGSSWGTQQKAPIPIPIPNPKQEVDTPPSLRSGEPPRKRKARSQIDPAWAPDETDTTFAESKGLVGAEMRDEAARFRDYHLQHASLMADWHAAWRTWVTSPYRKRPPMPPTNGGQRPPSGRDLIAKLHYSLSDDRHEPDFPNGRDDPSARADFPGSRFGDPPDGWGSRPGGQETGRVLDLFPARAVSR